MKQFLIFITALLLVSCSGSSNSEDDFLDGEEILDGDYCAEVEYYNPNTGTNSTYTLNVYVSDDYLEEIYWSNGGWLDEDHFSSTYIGDGSCSFTSDMGYDYEVTLNSEPCSFTDEGAIERQAKDDHEAITCSRCGYGKYQYDDYCDDCTDEVENTCSKCGSHEYGVYGGVCDNCVEETTCSKCGNEKDEYDDYCDDCVDEIENTCSRCGSHSYGVNGGLCDDCIEEDENEEEDEW